MNSIFPPPPPPGTASPYSRIPSWAAPTTRLPVATSPPVIASPPRMAWLDALRGFAAVVVAGYHALPHLIGPGRAGHIHHYFDLGKYGVLLFFLVSGYVIPMSLERHGSPRKFWVGRLFRIYPAYLAAIAVVLTLIATDVTRVPPSLRAETVAGGLGHIPMLQEFVGVRGLVWPFWTLSFEMTFYLIVVGLFTWGLHRFSAWWAGGLALTAALAGGRLPDNLFGSTAADRRLTAAVLVLAVGASLLAYLSGRRALVPAAGLAGLGFLLLPLLNGHASRWATSTSSWQAILMLAVMFAGTVIYRLHHGQINPAAGVAALAVVLTCSALTTGLRLGVGVQLIRWTAVTLAVAGTFALGYALRHRPVPALLTWLGAISYSVYLLHLAALPIVLYLLAGHRTTLAERILLGICFAALTLAMAWLSYRYVERPGQALGRRVQRFLDARLGPDQARTCTSIATQRAALGTAGREVGRSV